MANWTFAFTLQVQRVVGASTTTVYSENFSRTGQQAGTQIWDLAATVVDVSPSTASVKYTLVCTVLVASNVSGISATNSNMNIIDFGS